MASILFSNSDFLLWGVVEKEYMKHGIEKFVSRACFVGTQTWLVRLPYSFLIQIFLQLVVLEKEYRKQNLGTNIVKIIEIVDKEVENLTRGR